MAPGPRSSTPGPRRYETPTFKQTIAIIQSMPKATRTDLEAIKRQHLKLGFTYENNQIHRALRALTDPARQWDHRNRRSGRST